jgi:regulation of enolase protein 1 (concanavalin A-like superfamily)
MESNTLAWHDGQWLNEPPAVEMQNGELVATAAEGSDLWRKTHYGFVHDTGHALLHPLSVGRAMELRFVPELSEQFDQAGLLVRVDAENWVKAGVEHADGEMYLGAVATRGESDWSAHPVPDWQGSSIGIRASRGPSSLVVRARRDDSPWQLLRVTPFSGDRPAAAGPYLCAPTRAGFTARFLDLSSGPADAALHS